MLGPFQAFHIFWKMDITDGIPQIHEFIFFQHILGQKIHDLGFNPVNQGSQKASESPAVQTGGLQFLTGRVQGHHDTRIDGVGTFFIENVKVRVDHLKTTIEINLTADGHHIAFFKALLYPVGPIKPTAL